MSTRKEANKQIVEMLDHLVETYPEMRFSQILYNFGFVEGLKTSDKRGEDVWLWINEFYAEPEEILDRVIMKKQVKETMDKMENV